MLKFFKNLFDTNEKQISRLHEIVKIINGLEHKYEKLTNEDLKETMQAYKIHVRDLVNLIAIDEKNSTKRIEKKDFSRSEKELNKYLLEILPDVYAIVREMSKRKYNRRHYDVQLMAGIVLAEGKIPEFKTGEGKTQTAWLPLALFALTGRGSHLITVNDYLAKSHAEYAGHIFSELGFTVGITEPNDNYIFIPDDNLQEVKDENTYKERMKINIQNPGDVRGYNLKECTKADSYNCDILYATNSEIGFDYLRDNMIGSLEELSQKELYFGIVDEVDSILIDEARTPLIISSAAKNLSTEYSKFANIVSDLESQDYALDIKSKSVTLTDKGADKVEQLLGISNLWEDWHYAHFLENALKAEYIFKKDKEYIVKNGEILIVDEFTGRILPGRRYSEGIHQAIEAKEGVEIKQESRTVATITFQNLFRLYKYLGGMTGTALTESEEFYKIYGLEVISIPTNKPIIRQDLTDVVYKNQDAKFLAVAKDIAEKHKSGQPILVGTTSVEKSEKIATLLHRMKIPHEVLNAKQHEREAMIVSNAGEKGAVTIATNMAGRGTDIRLGDGVKELGGLYVIGTERHESRRIDNQLRGRAGRQGDPGISKFYLALDDEIMKIQGGMLIQKMMIAANIPDDMPIESSLIGNTIQTAQKKVEGNNFDTRKNIVEFDDVMNKQREIFYTRRRNLLQLGDKAGLNIYENPTDTHKLCREELVMKIKNIINDYLNEIKNNDNDVIADKLLALANDGEFETILKEMGLYKLGDIKQDLIQAIVADSTRNVIYTLIEKLFDTHYKENGLTFLRNTYLVMLETMSEMWMDHLETMVDLRNSVRFSGYAQKDPLVEYKSKGFDYFERFINAVDMETVGRIFNVKEIRI